MYALDGIRVLDLTRIMAGPWSTQILADLGADVVKIEHPGSGDDTRSWGRRIGSTSSTYFLSANRNKRSVAVDFNNPAGVSLILDLASKSDVVVENFKEGGLKRFGLDYQSLAARNPKLIYCSISGYGRESPSAGKPGYDLVAQAEAGLMAINGELGQVPLKFGVAAVDLFTGMYATQAILAALLARNTTGVGQHIDLALFDCGLSILSYLGTAALANGHPPPRHGNEHPDVVPYGLFKAADGPLIIAIGNDGQFKKFCSNVLMRADIADDPRFATNRLRAQNRQELRAVFVPAVASCRRSQLLAGMQAHAIPGGEVREVGEALASADAQARRMVRSVPIADGQHVDILASPLKLSGTPVREPVAPPEVGEHTDLVLREILGLASTEIQALRQSGAVA